MLLLSAKMSKTSWQAGNLKMNKDLVNHLLFGALVGYLPNSEIDKARIQQFDRKCYVEFDWLCFDRGENLGGRYSGCLY